MPEYLAPGVYVEEIDSGSKPIEGVSTSTSAVVGVTERGPVNVPILTTSFGEFTRWFGGYLRRDEFSNNGDPHCYLPHAVEGFFTNRGKRLFVVRVLDAEAASAETILFDRGTPGAAAALETQLLHRAALGSSTIYVAENVSGFSATLLPTIRIGDGSDADYRRVTAVPKDEDRTDVALRLPLAAAHADTVTVNHLKALTVDGTHPKKLAEDAKAGAIQIKVDDASGLGKDALLRIGTDGTDDEYMFVAAANPATNSVILGQPLQLSHAEDDPVRLLNSPKAENATPIKLLSEVLVGDAFFFVSATDRKAHFTKPDLFIQIDDAERSEIRRTGEPGIIQLGVGAYSDYAINTLVEAVDLKDDASAVDKSLMANVQADALVLTLDDRQGLNVGDVVRIGQPTDPDVEFVAISAIPNPGLAPNTGNIVLSAPLQRKHTALTTKVRRQSVPVARKKPSTTPKPSPTALLLATPRNSPAITLSGSKGFVTDGFVRVSTGSGVFYHRVASKAAALTPVPVQLDAKLDSAHPTGAPVVNRNRLLLVQALDPGVWGDRLRVSVQDQDPPLLRTQISEIIDSKHIRLKSASGVESGTILQRTDAAGQPLGDAFKVVSIDRQANNLLTLSKALPPGSAKDDAVRSVEIQLNVILLRQPDLAVPTRSENVLDFESFRYISMDPHHSRYVEKVIGTTWNLGATEDNARPPRPLRLEDRRSEGESRYVRIYDVGKDASGAGEPETTLESIRLGPEALVDVLPDGRPRPARRALTGGNDLIPAIADDTYIGTDHPEPLKRTGLFSLRNEEEISIVAIPGRTGATIQGALIDHCELMRYRFAVLDAQQSPKDSLNDVQTQRQQFDTKYAALYHPWPLIPEPFPANLAAVMDYPIPPSGHVMGVYARTDNDRGVHKAPANEVLRGVIGLQRILNKGEQDILNPYPVNINVIRDFRPNNRGIRVWGGRVITSDPDWKYVNVRRLLIFIEASLDRGLQWVVFEPNAEPLWARVNRTVSNFLSSVWRDGGLEGTKAEEAYFVSVDRTTMTQTDIDNGRLIVVIGVAPVKPAEFVIIRIGLWTAHAET